jgi:hypothetical protein
LTEEQVELIVNQAEVRARQAEVVASEARRQRKIDKIEEETRAAAEADAQQSSTPPGATTENAPVATENSDQDGDANAT